MSNEVEGVAALKRLLAYANGRGVRVVFESVAGPTVDARYRPSAPEGPEITIYRRVGLSADPWRETRLLAHEFGHHVSAVNGWRTAEYQQANDRMAACANLDDTEVLLVLREECIAWRVGALALEACSINYPDYERYSARSCGSTAGTCS